MQYKYAQKLTDCASSMHHAEPKKNSVKTVECEKFNKGRRVQDWVLNAQVK